jgi:hypothetical protein
MTRKLIRWILLLTLILVAIICFNIFWNNRIIANTPTLTNTPIVIPTTQPTATTIPTQPIPRPTNYFVSPTGNDSDPGSLDKPWKTIQYTVDHVLPGDTIFIRDGIYQENIRISISGTEKAPILLTRYSSGEVVIDGGSEIALSVSGNVGYWTISGLTFRSSNRYTLCLGWWEESFTENWIIRNNNIEGANFIRGANHLWENNNISGIGYKENLGDAGIYEAGESHHNIYRSNNIHDFTKKDARGIWSQGKTHDSIFENNTITNINADNDGGQCIDLDGAGNVEWRHTVRGNRVSNCNYVGIQLENVFESVIENNQIVNATSAGIIVINYDSDVSCKVGGENNQYGNVNGDCRGMVVNNILRQNIIANSGYVGGIVSYWASGVKVYNNIVDGSSYSFYIDNDVPSSNNWDVRGNIFSNYKKAAISLINPSSLIKDENNLFFTTSNVNAYYLRSNPYYYYSLARWKKDFKLGQGSKVGDPLYIDPSNLDFHVQPNSPVIDAGIDPGIQTDFDGKPRLTGSNFDIGPFENIH